MGRSLKKQMRARFWLELISEEKILDPELVKPLHEEANEIVAIMTASRKTAEEGKKSG